MPNLNDFYNAVVESNTHLTAIDADLHTLHGDDQQIHTDIGQVEQQLTALSNNVTAGFANLAALQSYADNALAQLTKQNETIICILEKVSQNTCTLVNQGDLEERALTAIQQSASGLVDMYQTAHPTAALAREREDALEKQILACCPPEPVPAVCTYRPCPAPPPFVGEPPAEAGPAR